MRSYALPLACAITILTPPGAAAQTTPVTFEDIPWVVGPATGQLGGEAQVGVPAGCIFTGEDGVRQFMELTENPVGGNELGAIYCEPGSESGASDWFVVFSYSPSGYVRDDERDQLDADAILESIRQGTDAANEERRRRGWGALSIAGWVSRPHYDVSTNNLTWALTALGDDGSETVNYSVRLLGREGVMNVDLVASPDQLASLTTTFDGILAGFDYLPGHRYAEWKAGDRIASYGLTALVAGGAGAVAAKTGLLAKMWKLILAAVVAVLAGLKGLWARLTGRGSAARRA